MNENYSVSISDPYLYGNITLGPISSTKNINNITLTDNSVYYKSHLEERIDKLEKQLDKIVEFLNKFLDTNIKI